MLTEPQICDTILLYIKISKYIKNCSCLITDYSSVAGTSTSHCERAVIDPIGPGQYTFNYTSSKWMDGETLRTPVYKCINQFKTTYKGETLQASITKYLLERVELPQMYIDKLKANLLY